MKKTMWLILGLLALMAVSCNMATRISDTAVELFEGDLVARVGNHRLHRKELENYIPQGVSPEDSVALAGQYIRAWAENLLLLDMAERQLSEEEKDLSAEMEEYRRTLLKYRYRQLYINQRLDTLVTDAELERYYKDHPDNFKLERPVIKSRYMVIPADSKALRTTRRSWRRTAWLSPSLSSMWTRPIPGWMPSPWPASWARITAACSPPSRMASPR